MAETLRRDPQLLHVTKYKRFSPLVSSESGERHVLQDTYSTIYRRNTFLVTRRLANAQYVDCGMCLLDLLLLEAALDDQPSGSVNGTGSTQFGEQELGN